jgi:GAF domain-containing protein
MSDELFGRNSFVPVDPEAPSRVRRLRQLGLGDAPVPEFDQFTRRLSEVANAPYAFVNFIGEDHQYLAGLHIAPAPPGASPSIQLPRSMGREYGFCPHVVVRRKALVLDDVCDYPRFAGNPVVDEIGIRSYLGAPLIDRTGTALGTICVVDIEPRPWGRAGLETIKSLAAELITKIHSREP